MAEVAPDLLFRVIARIEEAQHAMRAEMRMGFAAVDHRFGLIDARFRDVRAAIADLDTRVVGMELRLAEVHMDHEKRLEALEARVMSRDYGAEFDRAKRNFVIGLWSIGALVVLMILWRVARIAFG